LIGCPAIPYKETPKKVKEQQWERPAAKILLPVSLVAAYFGAMGTHEGGHALAATAYGADSIKINILPSKFEGRFHLGLTSATYSNRINSTQDFLSNISGPSSVLAGQIMSRELLKTGLLPLVLQAPMQWYAVGCKFQFYGEVLWGISRIKTSDFGKEPVWAPLAFGVGGLLYDIWDIVFCDNPERYFKCLVGEAFYHTETEQRRLFAYFGSRNGGGEFAVVWCF
jgi:hypothetical protein